MNMKPSWDDAPEWAQCLAMDTDDIWYWYENKPVLRNLTWGSNGGKMCKAVPCVSLWDKSLEKRKAPSPMNIDKIANVFKDRIIIDHEDAENLRIEAEAFARRVMALVKALHNLDDERVTAVLGAHEVSI